ncbi:MAG: carboxypeptidase-like regulatory domain-containing protein, partial [Bacteroidota bacterium]
MKSELWNDIMGLKRILLIVTALTNLFGGILYAGNTGKISGRIKDKTTGDEIVGVTVVVNGTKLGALTDLSGDYYIINVPAGSYSITASIVGYQKVTQTNVEVRIDQTTNLNFQLKEQVIEAEGVMIVAEKPKVELDLTASKQTVSKDEISNGWVKEVKDVIADQTSTNINGGIRGSFGGDVSYRVDGLDLRDVGSNTNFSSVNLSTVQTIEVLTGGWNAEYGQANGAIVNIVSRKATDQIHAVATYKNRPADKYHWGRNIYDKNDVFHTVMTTPDFWDTSRTWRTQWMAPGESQKGNLGDGKFAKMTPQEKADWWKAFINDSKRFPQFDYTDRAEWEQEVTIYGPIIPELSFLLSGRYKEGVGIYPSSMKYNPDMTFQGSLDWTPASTTVVSVNGMFTKFKNSGAPRTSYQSSETIVADNASQSLPFIDDPYNKFKYWLSGPANNGGSFGDGSTVRAPERAQLLNLQAKLTQVFSPQTFLDLAFQHSQMEYNLDFSEIAQTAQFVSYGLPSPTDSVLAYGVWLPSFGKPPTSNLFDTQRWGYAGDIWRSESKTKNYSVKADLTSQVDKSNLVKTGLIFSLQEVQTLIHEGNVLSSPYVQVNDIIPIIDHPYEGSAYVQDKIEVGGMVLNAGIRFDFFNANKSVSKNFYDPLMISQYTDGNSGKTGLIGYRPDGSGSAYVKTPMRTAFSPRIGISHPITETTVLHFMFGIFNQRPSWVKILSNPVVWTDNRASGNLDEIIKANGLNSNLDLPES